MTESGTTVANSGEQSPPPRPVAPSHYISVAAARRRYLEAGFPRTEKAIQGYAKNGTLTKHDEIGPNGRPKFFIDPNSIEQHIVQLAQLHHLDDGPLAVPNSGEQSPPEANVREHSQPEDHEIASSLADSSGKHESVTPDQSAPVAKSAERSQPEVTQNSEIASDALVYSHPYVRRLEGEVDEYKKLYRDQVSRTEQIQRTAFDRLIELQRSSQIAQSQTLADFFIKTRDYLLGRKPDDADDKTVGAI